MRFRSCMNITNFRFINTFSAPAFLKENILPTWCVQYKKITLIVSAVLGGFVLCFLMFRSWYKSRKAIQILSGEKKAAGPILSKKQEEPHPPLSQADKKSELSPHQNDGEEEILDDQKPIKESKHPFKSKNDSLGPVIQDKKIQVDDGYLKIKSGTGNPLMTKHIIRYLSTKKELGRVAQVCKDWQTYAREGKVHWINHHPKIPLISLGIKFFTALTEWLGKDGNGKKLEVLNLESPGREYIWISDHQFKELIPLCPNLKYLSTGRQKHLTNVGLASIAGFSKLQMLFLGCFPKILKAKKEVEVLVHIGTLSSLQTLGFDQWKIKDAGLSHLTTLSLLRNLRLDQSKITDAGIPYLKAFSGLQVLYLIYCYGVSGSTFAQLNKLSSLQKISLISCPITDTGIEQLVNIPALEDLDLTFCNKITDKGFLHLAYCPSLKYLCLKGCNGITDAHAVLLHLASTLPSLQIIKLTWCEGITDISIKAFKCKVEKYSVEYSKQP